MVLVLVLMMGVSGDVGAGNDDGSVDDMVQR